MANYWIIYLLISQSTNVAQSRVLDLCFLRVCLAISFKYTVTQAKYYEPRHSPLPAQILINLPLQLLNPPLGFARGRVLADYTQISSQLAYILIDTKWNSGKTWGLKLCFWKGLFFESRDRSFMFSNILGKASKATWLATPGKPRQDKTALGLGARYGVILYWAKGWTKLEFWKPNARQALFLGVH